MKLRKPVFALAVLVLPAFAADYSMELKPENTRIAWTLADPLHTVRGAFSLKTGRIRFDPETGKASGQIVVDVTSGNSGSEARDRRMHANVLESATYPEAVFVPARVEGALALTGASHVKLIGTLTLHGAAHEVSMDVRTAVAEDRIQASIAFDVPYVAWGLKDPGNFLLKVDKTVRVSIEANGTLK